MLLGRDDRGRYQVTLTPHELSALLAGARMSLALMEADPQGAPPEAQATLSRVLQDFDRSLNRERGCASRP